MNLPGFPKRTVHLDFHTGPSVPDIGRDFDAERFARTFKDAHVDSVTVFATCHHGNAYWDTDRPERHPGLPKGFDLLGEEINALHKLGIRAPIYLSVQCNEFCANAHPDWIALQPDLRQVKWGGSAFTAGWQIMDMSSPYQEYLAGQLEEVLNRFAPVDGIFLDMCWDQPSCSKWALAGMAQRGYNPESEGDRVKYAREVALEYMKRFRKMVDDANGPDHPVGVWFNSRPKTNLHVEKELLRHVEVEALPTGGWGYSYFPYVARFVRPLGLPALSHTGRFFKSWGDNGNLKPEMALKYECCSILSQGLTNGIGDLLHPRGVPNAAVYDLIGKVYGYIEKCEPYVDGGTILSQIALIADPGLGDNPGPAGLGATRALTQLRQQFDVVPMSADISKYELVIIPENTKVDSALKARLQDFAAKGGALIVCGKAALDGDGRPIMPELGIDTHGESPYSHTFMHAAPAVSKGLADYGYVMYERGFRMTPKAGAQSLAQVGEPYFQRSYDRFSGHEYTPENGISEYSAVVQNGNVITFSVPILEAYGKHGSPNYRQLLGNCIDRLLSRPLVRCDGWSRLETTVVAKGDTLVVHLLSFCPERRADGLDIIEDAIPVVDMPISVKRDSKPARVLLAPMGQELPFEYEDGYISARVSFNDGHAMVVIG